MNINTIDENIMKAGAFATESQSPVNMIRTAKEGATAAASFVRDDGRNGMFGAYAEKHSMIPDGGIETDAKNRKNFMTVMANTLSPEAFGKMKEEGYDIGSIEPEDAVNITDRIKAEMAKSGKVISGYNDDLDAETLEEITGSKAYAEEISAAFKEAGLKAEKDSLNDVQRTVEKAVSIGELSEDARMYMVRNELPPTTDNLYLAANAGSMGNAAGGFFAEGAYVAEAASVKDMDNEALRAQIRDVIERSGAEADESSIALAERMIERGLPLTEESFTAMLKLDELKTPISPEAAAKAAVNGISDGVGAGKALLTEEGTLLDKAVALTDEVKSFTDEAADLTAAEGKKLNIRNLRASQLRISINVSVKVEKVSISARRQLEEARLSMTVESSYMLLKSGMSLDTLELSDLVDSLKKAETELKKSMFGTKDAKEADEREDWFKETLRNIEELPGLPLMTAGDMIMRRESLTAEFSLEAQITTQEYAEAGRSLKARLDMAGSLYETMMTEVRPDLGDSIGEAFRHASSLMEELGIENTDENARAVRILGYNSMELSQENINAVKSAVATVDRIIERMTPEETLRMIRQGVNPMKLSMEELDKRLAEAGPSGERYSEYLVKLENRHRITSEEKESYIGIYRMLHQISKKDGAAIGSLINQGSEISFENLMTAVRSMRDKGMDVSVDDAFRGMESAVVNDIDEQIATAYAAGDYLNTAEMLEEAANAPERVYTELMNLGITPSAESVTAYQELKTSRGGAFDLARTAVGIAERRRRTGKDGSVSSESVKPLEDKSDLEEDLLERFNEVREGVLDSFTGAESAQEAYMRMVELSESMIEEAVTESAEPLDIRRFTSALKQLSIAGTLCREESYEIPMSIGGEESTVNVRIIHESSVRANVEINMDSPAAGRLRARFTAEQGGISGLVAGNEKEGVDAASKREEVLKERLSVEGIELTELSFVLSEGIGLNIPQRNADVIDNGINTAALYKTAKIFISCMSEG
ncbi:MAG: DUF6240 domain-containing protein [Lachnospiraceae bacterium]|nr:DUF6240 domain-containing protein [Lachnospiraceae bacterium]